MEAALDSAGFVLDLYAGAGGWDVGAATLGLPTVGLEVEQDPCVTALRAGYPRVRADVSTYPTAPFVGRMGGLVASPPCQAWSMAGNRKGEGDRRRVHDLVDAYAGGLDRPWLDEWADDRSHHAAQPVRWIRDLRPTFVCLEQVPPVIDLWRHIAETIRRWGYSTWAGKLNAANYGVPQTRERAILVARLDGPARPPMPTHAENPATDLFGMSLTRWVSMSTALGGLADSVMTRHELALRNNTHSNACERTIDEPSGTLFFGDRLNDVSWVVRMNAPYNATDRTLNEPAPTATFSRSGNARWVAGGEGGDVETVRVTIREASVLQSFPPDYPWSGNKTSQFRQVGNAIPPVLAAHILATASERQAPTIAEVNR
jgi:DNA (cytosine-5)-methyltransferase 1